MVEIQSLESGWEQSSHYLLQIVGASNETYFYFRIIYNLILFSK